MSGSGDAAAAAEVLNLVEPKQLTKKKVCLGRIVALDGSRMVNVSLCKVLPCAGGKNFSLCRDRAEHSESKFTSTFPYIDQYLNSLSRSHHRGRRTARHQNSIGWRYLPAYPVSFLTHINQGSAHDQV